MGLFTFEGFELIEADSFIDAVKKQMNEAYHNMLIDLVTPQEQYVSTEGSSQTLNFPKLILDYQFAFKDACAYLVQTDPGAVKRLQKKYPELFKE